MTARHIIQTAHFADIHNNLTVALQSRQMPSRRLLMVLLVLTVQARHTEALRIDSRQSGLTEYLVAGTVVWAHAGSASIAIRGSDLLGYLRIRVKSYRVKQANALIDLRPGDKITAVFSRRDGMLHRLRRVRTSPAKSGALNKAQ
jgi:hypothetical protein